MANDSVIYSFKWPDMKVYMSYGSSVSDITWNKVYMYMEMDPRHSTSLRSLNLDHLNLSFLQ